MNDESTALLRELLAEVVQIKRLLVFKMAREDYAQQEIAEALGVNQSTVSRYYPTKTSREARKNKQP